MRRFTLAIERALNDKNWYAALSLALIIPDVCGKIQYPEKKSQERYVAWFQKYLEEKYTHEIGVYREKTSFLSAVDCYALRCSLLHEGSDEITTQHCKKVLDKFLFATTGSHCNLLGDNEHPILQLDVSSFCKDICEAVTTWSADVSNDKEIQKRFSSIIHIHTESFTLNGMIMT